MSEHFSEEDLILHYYGELPEAARASEHLAGCTRCRTALTELCEVLALVDRQSLPEPLAGLEQRVWSRLEPEIGARRRPWFSRVFDGAPRWALAGGAAVIVLAAFIAGRFSGPAVPAPPAAAEVAATSGAPETERVLTAALGDHLDQSQMMLVELLNADLDRGSLASEQTLARDLVSANRLYRQTVKQTGDEALADILDDLERLLLEIANASPAGQPRGAALAGAQANARDLLFRVRLMASEIRAREDRVGRAQPTS